MKWEIKIGNQNILSISMNEDFKFRIGIFGKTAFLVQEYMLMCLELRDLVPKKSDLPGIKIKEITVENISDCVGGKYDSAWMLKHNEKLGIPCGLNNPHGIFGFIAYTENKPAGFQFVLPRGADSGIFRVKHIEAYSSDVFVFPEFRGHKVSPYLYTLVVGALKKRGVEQLWAAVNSYNIPQLKSVGSLGFKARGSRKFYRFFGFGFPLRRTI